MLVLKEELAPKEVQNVSTPILNEDIAKEIESEISASIRQLIRLKRAIRRVIAN